MHTRPQALLRRAALLLAAALVPLSAWPASPAELQARYAAAAGAAPSAARGERFFADRHGRDWSCASCHGNPPAQAGRHASTGKPIEPLAPAANARRFTDEAKVEKWFGRNCNDVLGRACTPGEKADVLAWLATVKP